MRYVLAVTALLLVASTVPGAARDYPWCARTDSNGFNGDCSFNTLQQCQATVSGQLGECMYNPRLAFDQQRGPRDGRRSHRDPRWSY